MSAFRPRLVQPTAETPLAAELERLHGLLAGERRRRKGAEPAAPIVAPSPRWAMLDALASRLGLDGFATDVVMLLLATELEPGFAELYGLVHDDPARRWPTLALAQLLFGGDPAASRAALLPASPLTRLRVVAVEPGDGLPLPLRPLRLEEPVVGWLLGRAQPDPVLAPLLRPLPPMPLDGDDERHADAIAERLVRERPVPRLRLVGRPRSGRRALAGAVAARLGLTAVEIEPVAGEAAMASLARDAALLDLAYVVDEAALDRGDRQQLGARDRLRRALDAFLVLLDHPGTPPVEGAVEVALPEPTPGRRRATWRAAVPQGDELADDAIDDLVAAFDLGPREIAAALRQAGGTADLRAAARAQAVAALDGRAEPIAPEASWDDLVLPDATAAQLREIVAVVRGRGRVHGAWGMAQGSRGRGIAVLFSGPSGTGKTTAAEVIARELDLDLWRIDLAATVSKWIGETEKNLKAIFDAAAMGGSILFFDEADALFGKRSEVKDARDRYANIEIDDLLTRVERHPGLAILATNRKADLDPAFLRRLRHVVAFPFPDQPTRRAIWARAFPPSVPTGPLDLDALAALELAGGSIRNVALNAACLAAADGAPVTMRLLLHAAKREYAKLERLPLCAGSGR